MVKVGGGESDARFTNINRLFQSTWYQIDCFVKSSRDETSIHPQTLSSKERLHLSRGVSNLTTTAVRALEVEGDFSTLEDD